MTRALLIVEPAMSDETGHHAFVARRFAEIVGVGRTTIAAHTSWPGPPTLSGAQVFPVFRTSAAEAARRRQYGPIASVLEATSRSLGIDVTAARRRMFPRPVREGSLLPVASADAASTRSAFTRDLALAIERFAPSPDDAILCTSANAEIIVAAAEILERGGSGPQLHLRVMYDDLGRHSRDLSLATAIGRLVRAPSFEERVRLSAETKAFAAGLAAQSGTEVAVIPHPAVEGSPRGPRRPDDPVVILVAGQPRRDKGADHLEQVLHALAEVWPNPGPALLVRSQTPVCAPAGVRFELLAPHLSAEDYAASWDDADLALMLHDPEVYARRGSGVVCDAVARRRPFVYLEGASLGEWDAGGNARGVGRAPVSIARALLELSQDLPRLAEPLEGAAQRLRTAIRSPLADA